MTSVTVFKTFKDVDKPYYVGIHKVLDGIRDGNVKELVQKIRMMLKSQG
jgi:hypothetical protein